MGQELSKEALWRNDLARIKRLQEFTAKVKFQPIKDEAVVTMRFSEPLVMDEVTLQEINWYVQSLVEQYGEKALMFLNQKVTGLMRDALLECNALFEDEYTGEIDVHSSDEEGVMLEGKNKTRVEKLKWG